MSFYGLHNLSPSPGARKIAKRVGRGLNTGAMCGRGNSGQNSRSGPSPCTGFSGGQTPLWQRFAKLGKRIDRAPVLYPVSLEHIQHLLLIGRLNHSDGIIVQSDIFKALRASCKQGLQGIKIVTENGEEGRWFDHRMCIIAGGFSSEAVRRIENELGGHAISVYHSPASFRCIVNDKPHGTFEPPMDYVYRVWYSSLKERGYLHETVRDTFKRLAPKIYSEYHFAPPMQPIRLPPLPVYS